MPDLRAFYLVAAALVAYILALIPFALSLSPDAHDWMFSEAGPFERLSVLFWLVLGVFTLFRLRRAPRLALPAGVAAIILGLREAEWHKAFTTDSLLKTNYYEMPGVSLWEKVPAGLVAIAVIGLAVFMAWRGFNAVLRHGGWRTDWGATVLLAGVVLPVIKVVDRAPAILAEDYGVTIGTTLATVVSALEEGVEMVLPLLFMAAVAAYPRTRLNTARACTGAAASTTSRSARGGDA